MKNDGHRKTTELLVLLVFGLFALCVASVLLMGGKTYQTLTHRGGINGSRRTAVRYLTTRFQQASAVRVEDFCGFPTLSIPEEIDGKTYVTRVYCYEGTVRELFSGADAEVKPGDGEVVMEAEKLTFSQEDRILTAEITLPDGKNQKLLLYLPPWKEGRYEK